MKNSILTKEHTSVSLDAIREIHEKNKQLLSLGYISKIEFLENNLILINELSNFDSKPSIKLDSAIDEFSIVRFRLRMQLLKNTSKN
ncbi:Uncharacterised protein [Elizabethkingia miricola]|jgi:hypothetical protein|uniref:Uncharacterized protein n=1 Tax=Elizabethkingia miricola TaxID=172045 RepID=A0ABD4DQX1_ELIMR|nr:hypothetical protein [Elizabethkingia miricola]KUY20905.1 hypothetical protein ATB95_08385 [Elizabethkingia miricola]SPW34285.1 Uncharacterised protein [Elizabethkingia miricola]DAT28646.1 MAG TPA: hypothetical protein [Caudoviricetes sp.]